MTMKPYEVWGLTNRFLESILILLTQNSYFKNSFAKLAFRERKLTNRFIFDALDLSRAFPIPWCLAVLFSPAASAR